HTPRTTPSGALHGMPLACLLGAEEGALEPLCPPYPALDLERVCVLGARSFEPEEAALLDRLGVRVLGMAEVRRRGLAACWAEALERVALGPYGVSIDLDAVDPAQAPGVGTPEPGGLDGGELAAALAGLRADPELAAVELMEYHPGRDPEGRTLRLLQALLCAALPLGAAAGEEAG
ncbi:MAG: arginase, partial [Gammaproteobacteria bacterium]